MTWVGYAEHLANNKPRVMALLRGLLRCPPQFRSQRATKPPGGSKACSGRWLTLSRDREGIDECKWIEQAEPITASAEELAMGARQIATGFGCSPWPRLRLGFATRGTVTPAKRNRDGNLTARFTIPPVDRAFFV